MTVSLSRTRVDRYLDAGRLAAGSVAGAAVLVYLSVLAGFVDAPGIDVRLLGYLAGGSVLAYANLGILTVPWRGRTMAAIGRVVVVSTALFVSVLPYTESFSRYAGWIAVVGLSLVVSFHVRARWSDRETFPIDRPLEAPRGAISAYTVGLALVTIWGAVLIFDGLGAHSFFHDEQHHAEVVMSVLEAQEFSRWNFVTGEPGEPYQRGYLVNAVGALLSAAFGYDELTLRAFPAFVATVTIPLVYRFVRRFTNRDVALAVTVAYVSNAIVVFFGRFLRPYTVFVCSYLVTLYLFDVAIDEFRAVRIRRTVVTLVGAAAAFGVAMQASQFAKIGLALLPMASVVYLWYDPALRRTIRSAPRATAAVVGAFVASLLILGAPGELMALPQQTTEFLSVSRLDDPTGAYEYYLFDQFVKREGVFAVFFVAGAAILSVRSVRDRDPRRLVFLLYTLVPLFVMVYLFDHFTDPRYVLYLVPFVLAVAIVPLVAVVRAATDVVAFPSARAPLLVILVTSLLVYPLSPVGPTDYEDEFAMKAPAQWEGDEPADLLHRRAVPPDFETAYGCLNDLVESGDVVIMTGQFETAYVEPQPGVQYYQLPWGSTSVTDHRTGEREPFFDVVEGADANATVYVLSTYVHLVDGDVVSWLLEDTEDLSAELDIQRFEYSGFYAQNDLYWPSLRYHGTTQPDASTCT